MVGRVIIAMLFAYWVGRRWEASRNPFAWDPDSWVAVLMAWTFAMLVAWGLSMAFLRTS